MEAIVYINPILGPDLGSLSIRSLLPDDALFWSITSAVAILFMAIALYYSDCKIMAGAGCTQPWQMHRFQ